MAEEKKLMFCFTCNRMVLATRGMPHNFAYFVLAIFLHLILCIASLLAGQAPWRCPVCGGSNFTPKTISRSRKTSGKRFFGIKLENLILTCTVIGFGLAMYFGIRERAEIKKAAEQKQVMPTEKSKTEKRQLEKPKTQDAAATTIDANQSFKSHN